MNRTPQFACDLKGSELSDRTTTGTLGRKEGNDGSTI